MIIVTYWQNAKIMHSPEDWDEINHTRIKSIDELPKLIENRPDGCSVITTEHSEFRKLMNGNTTNFFKVVWQGETPHRPKRYVFDRESYHFRIRDTLVGYIPMAYCIYERDAEYITRLLNQNDIRTPKEK